MIRGEWWVWFGGPQVGLGFACAGFGCERPRPDLSGEVQIALRLDRSHMYWIWYGWSCVPLWKGTIRLGLRFSVLLVLLVVWIAFEPGFHGLDSEPGGFWQVL